MERRHAQHRRRPRTRPRESGADPGRLPLSQLLRRRLAARAGRGSVRGRALLPAGPVTLSGVGPQTRGPAEAQRQGGKALAHYSAQSATATTFAWVGSGVFFIVRRISHWL